MEEANGPGQTVFSGRAVSVRVDPVKVAGRTSTREVVQRVPAVGILAETDDHRLVVIQQYRWAVQQWLWELPAGKVDADEEPLAAAVRELKEETGYRANQWQLIYRFYPSPGYTNEEIYLFYATGLDADLAQPEPDEDIRVESWDKDRICDILKATQPLNAIWLVGIHWWLAKNTDKHSL